MWIEREHGGFRLSPIKDLTGQKFGALSVVRLTGTDENHQALWECLCDCGKKIITRGSYLRGGQKRSCGCMSKPGRPPGEVGKLAKRLGISRQAAWFRLRRASGKPSGRPRGKKNKRLNPATVKKITRRYVRGEHLQNLASAFRVSSYKVRRLLVKQGIKIRRTKYGH